MLNNMPLDELRRYRPELAVPPGLEEFWDQTLAQTYPFNNHEGDQSDQELEKLAWLRKVFHS